MEVPFPTILITYADASKKKIKCECICKCFYILWQNKGIITFLTLFSSCDMKCCNKNEKETAYLIVIWCVGQQTVWNKIVNMYIHLQHNSESALSNIYK